ncbi:hypothetical protein K474DRAFT_1637659 [Panus rudis PR-1116 ss-1]|nr:hypothetical protein K474DRAFT_1637659 [Panus rudis PR-1116 ss-1]
MTHKLAEPYSGKNPVPQIATKLTSLLNPDRATEAQAQQLQDQSDEREEKQTAKRAGQLAKGHGMWVKDPTTGEELEIKNADEEPDTRNKGRNVLDADIPEPDWDEHRARVVTATKYSIVYIAVAYTFSFLISQLVSNTFRSALISLIPPSLLTYVLLFRLHNISRSDFEDRIWHSERMQGLKAGADVDGDGRVTTEERTKESAEWANAVLRGVWPILNPDLFSSVVDMLEDIMQASAPSFIHSVRISDLGLGKNAARITAIRSLPDAETREMLSSKAKKGESASFSNEPYKPPREPNSDAKEGDADSEDTTAPSEDQQEELEGDHVNLEVSFAYRNLPSGRSAESKAGNVHLLVEFFVGMQGVYAARVPVWVEVTGVVGTARARLQLISDPPFVKTTMVSLMGLPKVNISVTALNKMLPNVMDIPFISGFISSSIDTAVAQYVAPKSLTLDLQQLISGDDIKKDTEAIGVLVVHIHRATDVKGMDMDGGSADPYITLTYSRLGKPLYSTRIIKGDRNPVFEETAILMVDVNTIRLREKLSFQLWDSDRASVDDMLGLAEIEILDLVRQRGKPVRKVSPLNSPDLKHRPGSIEYTVGYYGKLPPTNKLKTDGTDPGIPEDLRDQPDFKQARAVALNDLEAAVLVTPPDPEWPSGILSVQVHEIKDLNVKRENRGFMLKPGEKEGQKGQDDGGEPEEESEGLPSSYCEISLNDELVYKTRVKPITSRPIFNAGTERFVRDWRKAHVTVAVKDSRMRENDAVLGVVMLKLSELLVNASEITRFYSLEEGLGYGRIRISLLFRPVEAKLPPNLLGFDTGTLEVRDIVVKTNPELQELLAKCEVRIKASKSTSSEKISRKVAQKRDDGSLAWPTDDTKVIPIRQRYGSVLLLSFKDTSGLDILHTPSKRKALGVLWLRDVVDNEEGQVEIALWQAEDGDYSRLKLNYVPPDGDLQYWDSDKDKVRKVGTVVLNLVFKPGISEHHRKMLDSGGKQKEAWDAFNRERRGGLRDSVGTMEDRGDEERPHPDGDAHKQGDGEAQQVDGGDHTLSGNPVNSAGGDTDNDGHKEVSEEQAVNTTVSPDDVEEVSASGDSGDDHDETDSGHESGGSQNGGKKGKRRKRVDLVGRFKDWKDNEKELHRDHRGLMQAKPVRTAVWVKDNVEESLHSAKERFHMKTRKPDVETEV